MIWPPEKNLAGGSKRLSGKAAGESKPEAYPQGYGEDFDEPRTKLADFFSLLLKHSTMKTARICFLWHMHQPYYTDPVAGSASMPWVRLHATKAYYDMAYRLEKFPSVKATFNFTPSLLRQLQEVGSGTVRDLFLEYAQRPAADLRPEEKIGRAHV